MKHAALILLTALSAGSVLAQDVASPSRIVGKLKDVQGFVTVVNVGQLSNAVSGAPLVAGSRVVATSGGSASLVYDNGCVIALKSNQSFSVQANASCKDLMASVGSVGGPDGSKVGSTSGPNSNILVSGGTAVLAAALNGRGSGSAGTSVPELSAQGLRPPVNFNSGR